MVRFGHRLLTPVNVVERAKRYTTAEVHQALFAGEIPDAVTPKTLAELKQGVRQRMQRRHADG